MKKRQKMHVQIRKLFVAQYKLYSLQWLVKCAEKMLCTFRKECNKYDLTAAQ